MKKLLIFSSDNVHVYKYIELIGGYFDKILLVCNSRNSNYQGDVEIVDMSLKNPFSLIDTPRLIRKIIKDFKPSVIHVHQANSVAWYAFRAAKGMGIPTVLTAWGSDILVLPKRSYFMHYLVKWNLRQADVLTSDSTFMADEMSKIAGIRVCDILIANFGIDIEPLDIPKENIIYSNRLHLALYRIDSIIYAFKRFVDTNSRENWRLVIAGRGELTDSLKSLVELLGLKRSVDFVGWVDKKKNSEYYSKAKIFVSIPESDATSISLLEAMSCGCIPVVSDLPANKEWIEDGLNGVLVRDINSNFLSLAFSINDNKARAFNRELIAIHATKMESRKRFLELYGRIIKVS